MIEKANPITSHEVVIMPPTATSGQPFGWIRLLNGHTDAGYVYLETPLVPKDPHLSQNGAYIVTAMPFEMVHTLLSLLRNQGNLQIRYFDPQSAGVSPSVFIESAKAVPGGAAPLAAEVVREIEGRRGGRF